MRHPTFEFSLPIFCLLAAVFAAGPAAAGDGKIHHNPLAVKDEYIVVLKDDTPFDRVPLIARSLAEAHGGQVERVWQHAIKGFFIRLPEQAATALSRDPEVEYFEENTHRGFCPPACRPMPIPPATCSRVRRRTTGSGTSTSSTRTRRCRPGTSVSAAAAPVYTCTSSTPA